MPNQTYDVVRDLAPVARLLIMPSILAVNNDVPAKTYAELIALAKAQPGKLSYRSPGVGTPQHIAGEMLKRMAGVDIVHVPYRGAMFTDVIGGRVTMTLQNIGAILPVVQAGPAARGRRHLAEALAGPAGPADRRRIRPAGLRGDLLVRPDGAGRHAAADRRQGLQAGGADRRQRRR